MSTNIGCFPGDMFAKHVLPRIDDIKSLLAFRLASRNCKNLVDTELLTYTLYLAVTLSKESSTPQNYQTLSFWEECDHASNKPLHAVKAYSPEQFGQLSLFNQKILMNLCQPRLQTVFLTTKAALKEPTNKKLKTIGCYQIRHTIKFSELSKHNNSEFFAAVNSQAKDIMGFIDTSGKFTQNPYYSPG